MSEKKSKPPPKKRGRKPKKKVPKEKPPPKKRGRKPKGGKIIKNKKTIIQQNPMTTQNIILHLKCNSDDLNSTNNINYTPNIEEPESYSMVNNNKLNDLQYAVIKENSKAYDTTIDTKNINVNTKIEKTEKQNNEPNVKVIWNKLNILAKNLRCNHVSDKCSACFWCTYDFDNPTIYIPKCYHNGYLEVYGCFCSPQCALAYLKNEEIDSSTKWERNALLNNVYSKIYDYKKNIKPAPSPFYTLDKYYGNLSIQEYRKLLKNDRVLMIVDKPMTKILPEIYEDNNEMPDIYTNDLYNKNTNYNSSKTFRLKRSQEKKLKKNALTKNFNL